MTNQETRSKLIEVTKRLLTDGTPTEKITARLIALEAESNLAMINYCFQSKDELLKIAVDELITEECNQQKKVEKQGLSAKQQLWAFLHPICVAMIKYREITKLSIPYLMLKEDILLPLQILPFVKAHFGEKKSETECRVIAFQLVYLLQLVFYRAEDFYKYAGIDVMNPIQLECFLEEQLNLLLGEDEFER